LEKNIDKIDWNKILWDNPTILKKRIC